MKWMGILLLAGLLLLAGCAAAAERPDAPAPTAGYQQIDQGTAREMMGRDDGHIVVDVRRFDEFLAGHIPGSVCIPNESIVSERPGELPNPNQIILIYCRSGNRSKEASEKLAAMGYTNVYEFGGINDWPGEVVRGQAVLVTVESNPTTGYRWEAGQDRELLDIQSFYTAAPQSLPVSGGGGWQSFILTPRQAGETAVSFTYSRPWEPGDADPRFTCVLEIGEDLSVTVRDDGRGQESGRGYAPTVTVYG